MENIEEAINSSDEIIKKRRKSREKNYTERIKRNKEKTCETMKPVFIVDEYREYENTEVRKLTPEEVERYMSERKK